MWLKCHRLRDLPFPLGPSGIEIQLKRVYDFKNKKVYVGRRAGCHNQKLKDWLSPGPDMGPSDVRPL